jgi:ArsR family transcriptional regulator
MKKLEEDCCESYEIHEDLIAQVKEHMPADVELDNIADRFKVFGDKTRIKILYVLHEKELCVCDIAMLLNMNQSAISHQLSILKQAKLIKNRRDGKQVYYTLDDEHVHTILSMCMEHIRE